MHVDASDWYAHGHETDPAYDNVILHVVYEEDRPVYRANGDRIPCLELKGRIAKDIIKTYWRLQNNEDWVPCNNLLHQIEEPARQDWLGQLSRQRLSSRARRFSLAHAPEA